MHKETVSIASRRVGMNWELTTWGEAGGSEVDGASTHRTGCCNLSRKDSLSR